MTYADLLALAQELPGVTETARKTEVDLFREGAHMGRLREKGTAFAFRLPWELIDELLGSSPEVFYRTPHYEGYPYVLARLSSLEPALAGRLIQAAWSAAPEALPTFKQPRA